MFSRAKPAPNFSSLNGSSLSCQAGAAGAAGSPPAVATSAAVTAAAARRAWRASQWEVAFIIR